MEIKSTKLYVFFENFSCNIIALEWKFLDNFWVTDKVMGKIDGIISESIKKLQQISL